MSGRLVRAEAREFFKATGENTGGRTELAVLPVGFGFGPPLHLHDVQENSFYVVDGVLTVRIAEDAVEPGPGDFATAPGGRGPQLFTSADREKVATLVDIVAPGIGFDH